MEEETLFGVTNSVLRMDFLPQATNYPDRKTRKAASARVRCALRPVQTETERKVFRTSVLTRAKIVHPSLGKMRRMEMDIARVTCVVYEKIQSI